MSYQKDNLDDFVANAAQPIDLTFNDETDHHQSKGGNREHDGYRSG